MQTRKSPNQQQPQQQQSTANSTPNIWQSTTLGALSRQTKAVGTSNGQTSIRSEVKAPFSQNQQMPTPPSSGNNSGQSVSQVPNQVIYSSAKKELTLGLNSHYQTDARSPTAKPSNLSANKRSQETFSAVKPHHHAYTAMKSNDLSAVRGSKVNNHSGYKSMNKTTDRVSIGREHRSPKVMEFKTNDSSHKNVTNDYGASRGNQKRASDQHKTKSGLTQIQTHSGTGSQQNLFIKNLFFIQGGDANILASQEDASISSRNTQNLAGMNSQGQIFESAPVTCKGNDPLTAGRDSNEHFSEHMNRHSKISVSSQPMNYSARSPTKTDPGYQMPMSNRNRDNSSQKAIDIANTVLQHLVPLTGPQSQIRVIPGKMDDNKSLSSLRVSLNTKPEQKLPQRENENTLKVNNTQQQPKSVSPLKSSNNTRGNTISSMTQKSKTRGGEPKVRESDDFDLIPCIESNGSQEGSVDGGNTTIHRPEILSSNSPVIENFGQAYKNNGEATQEISLFNQDRVQLKQKKSSYGEMPKYHKSGSQIQPQMQQQVDTRQQQVSHIKAGSQSRNNGEVFSYKMKTMNIQNQGILKNSIKEEQIYNATSTQNLPAQNQVENSSDGFLAIQDKNNFQSANRSSPSQKHQIAKSHSQHQFKMMKKGTKEQFSAQHAAESQEPLQNDNIYMSIGNLSIKQPQISQAPDYLSYNGDSQLRYESGYGDKQSEISSNFDRADKQSIRVMARFRPFNNIEKEIQELYPQRSEIVQFNEDQKTIKLMEEFHTQSSNLTFTFDHIFMPDTSQVDVFNLVGSQMIEDIMYGYNGTIFAYGQTGSGKTFTMYGDDIFDESKMGLVPRAARQIFDHIREQDLEVEYTIRVQMLEIYKETLRDLLHNSNERPPELKIKEDPKRGTYVEGLQDVCIVNEDEIMSVICTGETMRHVASTQLNQVSSRSHSICMIEVVSKYPNDSERRGVLNLVDLAGSERVSRSMAQGPALEEAKKINFSLSMLGKVINSLTKNHSHIPYRDSKLTRLLKESLGGNNKTSLIVACSTHHSNFEETLSSLRFAQSAKFIQNKVKLNIKTSNQQLQVVIEQLKNELRFAKEEIQRLRICTSQSQSQIKQDFNQSLISSKNNDDDSAYKPIVTTGTGVNILPHNASVLGATPLQAIHNFPHQSLSAKNYDVIENNNQQTLQTMQHNDISSPYIPMNTQSSHSPTKPFPLNHTPLKPLTNPNHHPGGYLCVDPMHPKLLQQLQQDNEELEMKLRSKESDFEAVQFQKDELQLKVIALEDKVTGYKHRLLALERKVGEQESEKDFLAGKEVTQTHKMRHYENQIKLMGDQVKNLESFLKESEGRVTRLTKEKQELYKRKVSELFEDTFRVMKVSLSKQLENLVQRATTVQEEYEICDSKDGCSFQEVKLKEHDMVMSNLYSMELTNQLIEGSIPNEVTIYLLKNQLVDICLANHNLQRYLSLTQWKLRQETTKHQAKDEICSSQEQTIGTLEGILDRTRQNQDKLKIRLDKVEGQMNARAQQMAEGLMWSDAQSNGCGSIGGETLTHRAGGTFNMETLKYQNNYHSQSLMSGSIHNSTMGGQTFRNSKTRFKRIINSKALQKSARNGDRSSPGSRSSIRAGTLQNQQIMSQYYGIKYQSKQQSQFAIKPQLSQIDSNTAGGSSSSREALQTSEKNQIEQDDFQRDEQVDVYRDDNMLIQTTKGLTATSNPNQVQLTAEDLKRIDLSQSLQDVKNFLQSKLSSDESSKKRHSMGQSTIKSLGVGSLKISSSRQHSSISPPAAGRKIDTGVSNLYQVSEVSEIQKENEAEALGPSTLPNIVLETSGIQEVHFPKQDNFMMTMNTENMLNYNSVGQVFGNIGGSSTPYSNTHYLFSRSAAYQGQPPLHLLDKIAQLQEQLGIVKDDADLQRARAEELKKVCQETKRQMALLKEQCDQKDLEYARKARDEAFEWEQAIAQIKRVNEGELVRKQREIAKLNELLGKWIEVFQSKTFNNGSEVQNLMVESVKIQKCEPHTNLLTEVMLSPTPHGRPAGQLKHMSFSNLKASAYPQKLTLQLSSMKSPKAGEANYYLQTPQTKNLQYHPSHTEYHHSSTVRAGHHLALSTVSNNAPLNTNASCTSPAMNIIFTEKQDQITIKGDNSPAHQHQSSFDEEEKSPDSTYGIQAAVNLDLNKIVQSPEGMRMPKTRQQHLSLQSFGNPVNQSNASKKPQQHQAVRRKTFVLADSQDSSQIEWNMLQSNQDHSENNMSRQSHAAHGNHLTEAAVTSILGSLIERQNQL